MFSTQHLFQLGWALFGQVHDCNPVVNGRTQFLFHLRLSTPFSTSATSKIWKLERNSRISASMFFGLWSGRELVKIFVSAPKNFTVLRFVFFWGLCYVHHLQIAFCFMSCIDCCIHSTFANSNSWAPETLPIQFNAEPAEPKGVDLTEQHVDWMNRKGRFK